MSWHRWFRTLRQDPARRRLYRRPYWGRLMLERLEDRTVLDASAILLTGNTLSTAATVALTPGTPTTFGGVIGSPWDQKLYAVTLQPNAVLQASLDSPASSADLAGVVEVFDSHGNQVAASPTSSPYNPPNGPPALEFLTGTGGQYYVGVSANPNNLYSPNRADSGYGDEPSQTGPYQLTLQESALPAANRQSLPGAVPVTVTAGTSISVGDQPSESGDANYYAVSLNTNDVLTATALSANQPFGEFSGTLNVLDTQGNVLASTSQGYYGTTQVIFHAPLTGTYYVGVMSQPGSGITGNGSGAYELQMWVSPPPQGPNDSMATAATVALSPAGPVLVSGVVNYSEPMYVVTLAPHSMLRLRLDPGTDANPLNGGIIKLYDSNHNVLAASDFGIDQSSSNISPKLLYVADTGGQFYIGVSGSGNYFNPINGSFQLFAQLSAGPTQQPGTDQRSLFSAPWVSTGQVVGDGLATPDAVNYYRVQLAPGQVLSLDGQGLSNNLSVQLSVLDATGTVVDVIGPQSGGNVLGLFRPLSFGTYYVAVSGPPGGTVAGIYELQFAVVTPAGGPADTLASAASVPLSPGAAASVSGEIGDADEDLYLVSLAPHSVLTLNLNPGTDNNPLSGGVLRLFDSSGKELVSNDFVYSFYGNAPVPSSLQFVTDTGGQFYVGVSGASNGGYDPTVPGTYDFNWSQGSYQLVLQESTLSPAGIHSAADALPVAVDPSTPTVVAGTLAAGAVDFYAVQLDQGQLLSVSGPPEFSSSFRPGLTILDAAGNSLMDLSLDFSGNSAIFHACSAGTYYLEANTTAGSYFDPGFGAYKLQLSVAAPPAAPNDTLASAAAIALSTGGAGTASGVIGFSDEDLYAVMLAPHSVLTLNLGPGSDNSPLTSGVLLVFDSHGKELASSDFAAASQLNVGLASTAMQFVTDSGGEFYIGVSGAGNDNYFPGYPGSYNTNFTQGSYQLSFQQTVLSGTALQDLADAVPVGLSLDGPSVVADSLPDLSVVHYYAVQLDQGQILSFVSSSPPAEPGVTVSILDAAGNTLASNFSQSYFYGQDGHPFHAPSAGTYYLAISVAPSYGFGTAGSSYELQLSLAPPPQALNDGPATAQLVSLPPASTVSVSGTITSDTPRLYYVVTLNPHSMLNLTLSPDGSVNPLTNGVIEVRDSGGSVVASTEGAAPAASSLQYLSSVGGQFYISVSYGFGDWAPPPGSFSLALQESALPTSSMASLADAFGLSVSSGSSAVLASRVAPSGGTDYYSVQLAAGQVLTVNARQTGSFTSSQLQVFDNTGQLLASNSSIGDTTSVVFHAPSSGTFYIAFSAAPPYYAFDDSGPYQLQLSLAPPPQGTNDSFASAPVVSLPAAGSTSVFGTISLSPQLYYVVNLSPHSVLSVSLSPDSSNPLNTAVVRVLDSGGNIVAESGSWLGGSPPALEYVTNMGGQFYVEVIGGTFFQPAQGSFQLSLQATPLAGTDISSQADALPVAVPEGSSVLVAGDLSVPGQVDYLAVSLQQGQRLSAYAGSYDLSEGLFSVQTTILDPAGNVLETIGDLPTFYPAPFHAPSSGTYYVSAAVGRSFQTVGAYQLSLTVDPPPAAPHDTMDSAEVIPISACGPTTVSGVVTTGDAQLYAASFAPHSLVTLQLGPSSSNPLTGGILRVFDAHGNLVADSDLFPVDSPPLSPAGQSGVKGGAANVTPKITFLSGAGGQYFIGVSGAGNDQYNPGQANSGTAGTTAGAFQLRVDATLLPTDPLSLAGALALNVDPTAPLDLGDALADSSVFHVYAVHLVAGQQLTIHSSSASSPGFPSVYLRVFDDSGKEIAYNSSSNLRFFAATTGTYYIGASDTQNTSYDVTQPAKDIGGFYESPYELQLAVTAGTFNGNDTLDTALPISFLPYTNVTLPGAIHNQDDVALYSLNLQQGDKVTLSTTRPAGSSPFSVALEPYVRLLDSTGNELANSGGSSFGNSGSIQYTVAADGTYYVGVSAAGHTAYDPQQLPSGALTDGTGAGAFQLQVQVDRALPSGIPVLTPDTTLSDTLAAGQTNIYAFKVLPTDNGQGAGQLILHADGAAGSGFAPQLTLFNQDHQLLISSTGLAAPGTGASIVQYLNPGIYYVSVSAAPGGPAAGSFILSNVFTNSSEPNQGYPISLPRYGSNLVPVDMSRAGSHTDLVTTDGINVVIIPGLGDGTFAPPVTISGYQSGPHGYTLSDTNFNGPIAVGDFNGDGIPDLAVVGDSIFPTSTESVTLLFGQPGGNFTLGPSIPISYTPSAMIAGNFSDSSSSGLPADLALVGQVVAFDWKTFTLTYTNKVTFLMHQPDGTFTNTTTVLQGGLQTIYGLESPKALAAGDFTQAGHTDLAVAFNDVFGGSPRISFLQNQGGGQFTQGPAIPLPFTTQDGSLALAVGNFVGNGLSDLAVTDVVNPVFTSGNSNASNSLLLFSADGQGGFQSTAVALAFTPVALAAADFNHDGKMDLMTADANYVYLLDGNADGTFRPPVKYGKFNRLAGLMAGDFNSDGSPDLAVIDSGIPGQNSWQSSTSVFVLTNRGDGTFQEYNLLDVGNNPHAIATGDFTDDGHLDLVTADFDSGTLSVLLGNGDATFQKAQQYQLGANAQPTAVVVGDFNGDGIPDIAVAESGTNDIAVLLGRGDGTFADPVQYQVDQGSDFPFGLAAADVNGDHYDDLVATNPVTGTVTVLLNNGPAGGFTAEAPIAVGSEPAAIATGDFTGDGHVDLAVANFGDSTVSILAGDGKGNFQLFSTLAVGSNPYAIAAGDFGNGHADIVTADEGSGDLSVLLSNGNGMFQPAQRYGAGDSPVAVLVVDFNGDHNTDLATVNYTSGSVYVLRGNGNGSFNIAQQVGGQGSGDNFSAMAAGDFNGDGHTDLALADTTRDTATVLLGSGSGSFSSPGPFTDPFHVQPVLADLNGDTHPDLVTVASNGDILFRAGRPTALGLADEFATPIVLNPGRPAKDIALVTNVDPVTEKVTNYLAALDKNDNRITFFGGPHGLFTATPGPAVQAGAAHIASADFNGDGLGDLVVTSGAAGTVSIFTATGGGNFSALTTAPLGNGPDSITLAKLSGGPGPDIVVTNQISGDVSVLLNTPTAPFTTELRYRAGTGPYDTVDRNSSAAVTSLDQPTVAVAGNFTGGTHVDLLVADAGTDSFSLLRGAGGGTFLNAQSLQPLSTGVTPTAAVAGLFDRKNDRFTDVAVLNQDAGTVTIFLSDGNGHLTRGSVLDVGKAPTSLTSADLNGDRYPDLIVTDAQGDALAFLGNGDGTFRETPISPRVSLAAAGPGQFIYTSTGGNSVTVKDAQGNVLFQGSSGLQAPGAAAVVDLPNGKQALVVTNEGGNDVLVFQGSNGAFDFSHYQTITVGTDPVGLTVADVNGDHVLDIVVANQDSNDVSILLGQVVPNGDYVLTSGQRLQVGLGPVSTALIPNAHGLPSLAVVNSADNTVSILPGRANGFFSDRPGDVRVIPTGVDPQRVLVGPFDMHGGTDLITVNAGSNDLTFVANALTATSGVEINTLGIDPVSAVAIDQGGFDGLVVANQGSGNLTLLRDTNTVPQVVAQVDVPGTPNPSDLLVAGVQDHAVGVFVTDQNTEQVVLAVFSLQGVGGGGSSGSPSEKPVEIQSAADAVVGTGGSGSGGGSNIPVSADTVTIFIDGTPVVVAIDFAGAPQEPSGGGGDEGPPVEGPPRENPEGSPIEESPPADDIAESTDAGALLESASTPAFSSPERAQSVELQPLDSFSLGIVALVTADTGNGAGQEGGPNSSETGNNASGGVAVSAVASQASLAAAPQSGDEAAGDDSDAAGDSGGTGPGFLLPAIPAPRDFVPPPPKGADDADGVPAQDAPPCAAQGPRGQGIARQSPLTDSTTESRPLPAAVEAQADTPVVLPGPVQTAADVADDHGIPLPRRAFGKAADTRTLDALFAGGFELPPDALAAKSTSRAVMWLFGTAALMRAAEAKTQERSHSYRHRRGAGVPQE